MTAYSEADRVEIRRYLGFGDLYLQLDPRLESAITSSQAVADGGTRPTSDAQLAIQGLIYGRTTKNNRYIRGLQDIEADLSDLQLQQGATKADEVELDAARQAALLEDAGRRLVHQLARMLDTFPRADVFSASPTLSTSQGEVVRDPYSGGYP